MIKKIISLSLLAFISLSGFSQTTKSTIDWKALEGKWEYKKVVWVNGKDSVDNTKQYATFFSYFNSNSKYKEVCVDCNQTTVGNYSIDVTKRMISFSGLVLTTKYVGKVAVPDMVINSGKFPHIVLKLTGTKLILLEKHTANSEGPGDYIYYLKKVQ